MKNAEATPCININIVKPLIKQQDQKSQNIKVPLSPKSNNSISLNVSRQQPIIENSKTDDPLEIQALKDSEKYMIQLLTELNQVIKENDATPEVQAKLSPLVEDVKQNYPIFLKQAIKYYQTYYQIHQTTETAQVLSTASVKIPLDEFMKGWSCLQKYIDNYADTHPPPHAKEISGKFDAIKSSLEIILQTNANRKFPNPGLGKSVLSIQSLCDSIANAVYELFMQPRFPNFQIDILSMYKDDVKSFLHVITDAFYNEFPQSGVALCDLARIKLNVVASCNEIIEALQASFLFPNSMKLIQDLKNSFHKDTNSIIETLSQPFNVVKPLLSRESEIGTMNQKKPEKTKEEETLERIAADNVAERLKNLNPTRKTELFLHDTLPFFNKTLSDFDDPWEALIFLSYSMKDFVKKYEVNGDNVNQLKEKIEMMKVDVKDANEYAKKKVQIAAEMEELRRKEKFESTQHIEKLNGRIAQLTNVINEKQEEIENIAQADEIGDMRRGILNLVNSINEHSKTPLDKDFSELSNRDLIKFTNSLLKKVFEEKESLKTSVTIERKIDLPPHSDENVRHQAANDILEDVMLFDTQPRDDLKVAPDSTTDHCSDASSIKSQHHVSNVVANAAVPRISTEIEKMKQELFETRDAHFSDLKLIISKLDPYTLRQLQSKNRDVVNQSSDNNSIGLRIELMSFINDQFEALQKLYRTLLDNDRDNTKTIRELTNELNTYKSELANALEMNNLGDKVLEVATNLIRDKQSPLNDKIIELSEELRQRDSNDTAITSRLLAITKEQPKVDTSSADNSDKEKSESIKIAMNSIYSKLYYDVKKTNTNANFMKLLRSIQDQIDEKEETITELTEKSTTMQDCLIDIELRLSKSINKESISIVSENTIDTLDNIKSFINHIQDLCDQVMSPIFSTGFVQISNLTDMFSNIPHDDTKTPMEFIPQICEKYIAMEAAINSTKPFLEILDQIFQGFCIENRIMMNSNDSFGVVSQQQILMLRSQVQKFHNEMKNINGSIENSPVSRLTSRFIALVQSLLNLDYL